MTSTEVAAMLWFQMLSFVGLWRWGHWMQEVKVLRRHLKEARERIDYLEGRK